MAKLAKAMADQMREDARAWKDGELHYCCLLIGSRGNDSVGRDPKTVATYLRMQSAAAFRDGEFVLSAALATAATAINCDARNNHEPNWKAAEKVMLSI
jgi:hypothetical protein